MKILVAVANYGFKNDGYLSRVLCEYRSMSHQIDVVVVSNIKKDLGRDVEVIAGTPTKNPLSLPFAHKQVFADRKNNYDLFIYSEDDILISESNIEAFQRVTNILPARQVAGLFRVEQNPDGTRFYPDAHDYYRWMPDSVKVVGDHTFARFTNDHSGCYMLTRSQLARAIASGGFVVPPHQYKYRLLETAATDPYTQCGLEKVLCVSHLEEFLVPHLPNKYIGSRFGLEAPDFDRELVAALKQGQRCSTKSSLLEPETKLFHSEWSKDRYEPCRWDLIGRFPTGTRTVLSVGAGWGETEAELVRKGIKVTGIPLDSVIAACAESRGLEIVYGDLEEAVAQLRGRRFDGVLMSGILHLLKDPIKALGYARSLLADRGVLVTTVPAFYRMPFLWLWLQHPSRYREWRDFQRSGVHPIGRRKAKTYLTNAGLRLQQLSSRIPERWKALVGASGGLAETLFASEHAFVGRRDDSTEEATEHSPRAPRPEIEPETNCVADGRAIR